ncbi:MAG: hypothetical protein ABIO55_02480 [Ginsengibacter sp.]
MKTFTKACMLFLLLIITYNSKAQRTDSRPKLFNGVENKIGYPKAELEKVFTKTKGSKYQISLPGNFNFTGTVVSSVQRYDNLKSFLIKSDILNGAMFSVSRRINEDNSISYTGRIINEKYSDGYELKADANGKYFLDKIDMNELIQDKQ